MTGVRTVRRKSEGTAPAALGRCGGGEDTRFLFDVCLLALLLVCGKEAIEV